MNLAIVQSRGVRDVGLIGRLIAERYRVREVIGRGGMGVVYSATDEEGGPDVVIKFLASEWTGDPEAAARFQREARRLSALRHPNIVRMRDFGHDDGRAYLVLEFVHGQPLTQRLRDAFRLSLQEFVPIAAQILKGVGHAHTRGVVLRDIKASNVMVCDRKGRSDFVILLDFGLAKRLQGETPITREHVMGTAGYIAPETLTGGTAGLASDVYAIGILFWTMLSGSPPFDAEDEAAVLYKTVHEPVPDLREALGPNPEVPERLAALIERCLSKSPDDRPKDANAIVEDLIDAVPSRMFRLPRVPGASPAHRGEGNTGMIALTGINPSGKHALVPEAPAVQENGRRGLWLGLGLGLLASAVAAGVVAFVMAPSDKEPTTVAVAVPTVEAQAEVHPAAVVSPASPVLEQGDDLKEQGPLAEMANPAAADEDVTAEADRLRGRKRKRTTSRRTARGASPARPRTPEPAEPTTADEPAQATPVAEAAAAPRPDSDEAKPPVLEKADEPPRPSVLAASEEKTSSSGVLMRPDDSRAERVPALMKPD